MTAISFTSPSSPKVRHDAANLITEGIMINKYGVLPPYSWRKGQALAGEWGQIVVKVKRIIKSLNIDARRLAWYVKRYRPTDLDYEEFGLLKWKVNTYFKWYNLDWFTQYYTELQKQAEATSSDYVERTRGYKMKEDAPSKRKTLTDILEELEQEDDDDE